MHSNKCPSICQESIVDTMCITFAVGSCFTRSIQRLLFGLIWYSQ